jgi:hypothetical protein
LWQTSISAGSATYVGQAPHIYDFYSIATDGAGNMEKKTVVDSSTGVNAKCGWMPDIHAYPPTAD